MGIKPFGDKHDFRYRAPGAASEWKETLTPKKMLICA